MGGGRGGGGGGGCLRCTSIPSRELHATLNVICRPDYRFYPYYYDIENNYNYATEIDKNCFCLC